MLKRLIEVIDKYPSIQENQIEKVEEPLQDFSALSRKLPEAEGGNQSHVWEPLCNISLPSRKRALDVYRTMLRRYRGYNDDGTRKPYDYGVLDMHVLSNKNQEVIFYYDYDVSDIIDKMFTPRYFRFTYDAEYRLLSASFLQMQNAAVP